MSTVPFKMDAYEGFAETQGVVRENNESISIEFQTKDAFIGLLKSDVKTLQIPFGDIEDILFDSGFFTARLRIQLKSLHAAKSFPTTKNGEIQLAIARKNRKQARSFASSVGLSVSQYHMMRDTEDDLELLG